MKEVTLNGPRVIDGAVRYPAEGPIPVTDDEYDRLVEAKAIDTGDDADDADDDGDGLDDLKVPDLNKIIADEKVEVAGNASKAAKIDAIRAHRAAGDQNDGLDDLQVADLDKVIADEKVEVANDAAPADKIAAIRAHRAAAAS